MPDIEPCVRLFCLELAPVNEHHTPQELHGQCVRRASEVQLYFRLVERRKCSSIFASSVRDEFLAASVRIIRPVLVTVFPLLRASPDHLLKEPYLEAKW